MEAERITFMFPLGFEPKLWPQGAQQEGASTYCGRVLSAGKTLIVDAEGADCRVEGIGASGPPAHQLFRTSDLRYLA